MKPLNSAFGISRLLAATCLLSPCLLTSSIAQTVRDEQILFLGADSTCKFIGTEQEKYRGLALRDGADIVEFHAEIYSVIPARQDRIDIHVEICNASHKKALNGRIEIFTRTPKGRRNSFSIAPQDCSIFKLVGMDKFSCDAEAIISRQ